MIIYLLKNTVNGKVYVGQTVQTLSERMRKHKSTSNSSKAKNYNNYLYKAIRKYGWNNFEVFVLDNTAKTQEQLNFNEISWIACFD